MLPDHLLECLVTSDLPPGSLTDLRVAAVNNENFARVAVKHNLHVHLRHGSSALEKQIRAGGKQQQQQFKYTLLSSHTNVQISQVYAVSSKAVLTVFEDCLQQALNQTATASLEVSQQPILCYS
ncbi:Ribonuclease III domain-containing protein [Cynara cardunculus var. scolymus]|uniref:Ribonuclease III domain-containing protein n=1 Tax=Cynara cardunculus var. scolymus TaxID=59895 RepID=A0A124SFJ9_CYNCS|nr:Ribonuclease III domain-containing protein [Cynara cardunculus var. scolymus]